MSAKWFIQDQDVVRGPFSTEEVHGQFQSGQFPEGGLVWGRGMSGWVPFSQWQSQSASQGPASGSVPSELPSHTWHYALHGKSHGPMSRADLITTLKGHAALGEIMIWTKGMKEWAPLFEFHDLLSDLGVNKRTFPRADIQGRVTLKSEDSQIVATLVSIGEGGFGVRLDAGVVPGQIINFEIQSTAFTVSVSGKAEVRYLMDGICGLRFSQVNQEAKNTIVSYVKQSQTRFVLKAS